MAHDFKFFAVVPHVPVPILPVTTLKLKAGNTPVAVIFTGCRVLRSQPASLFDVARHSITYTWSWGLNPVPHTLTLEPFLRFLTGATWNLRGPIFTGMVVVVVVVGLGSAKVIGKRAASALGGLVLTTIAQLERSVDVVPQVDVPATVPATTVTDAVNVPVPLVVAILTVLVSQSVSFVEAPSLMHSRA